MVYEAWFFDVKNRTRKYFKAFSCMCRDSLAPRKLPAVSIGSYPSHRHIISSEKINFLWLGIRDDGCENNNILAIDKEYIRKER